MGNAMELCCCWANRSGWHAEHSYIIDKYCGITKVLEQHLREIIEPLVIHAGMELVQVEYLRTQSGMTLRITIDKDGGVSVDDCAHISRLVSDVLDVKDPIPGAYNLEVSSPGINRPLVREEDFRRFAGEKVYIKTRTMRDGRRRYRGILRGIEDGAVRVEAADGLYAIPFVEISRARLDII